MVNQLSPRSRNHQPAVWMMLVVMMVLVAGALVFVSGRAAASFAGWLNGSFQSAALLAAGDEDGSRLPQPVPVPTPPAARYFQPEHMPLAHSSAAGAQAFQAVPPAIRAPQPGQ